MINEFVLRLELSATNFSSHFVSSIEKPADDESNELEGERVTQGNRGF